MTFVVLLSSVIGIQFLNPANISSISTKDLCEIDDNIVDTAEIFILHLQSPLSLNTVLHIPEKHPSLLASCQLRLNYYLLKLHIVSCQCQSKT
jgi:hypothetical protein